MVVGEFTESADLLVIGGGPGGYVAAIRAAQLGRQVTLVERQDLGGICLNVGCIPSKALISVSHEWRRLQEASSRGIQAGNLSLDLSRAQHFKSQVVERLTAGVRQLLNGNQVAVIQGEARFVGPHQVRVVSEYESKKLEFAQAIIATGSRPRILEGLPEKPGSVVMGSTELLALEHVPEHLAVVGGGYIGMELGTAFLKFGAKVTVIEATSALLAGTDPTLVRVVERRFHALGGTVHLNASVTEAQYTDRGAELTIAGGDGAFTLTADAVLVTVGRVPNTDGLDLSEAGVVMDEHGLVAVDHRLRTKNPDIAAIGDITPGPMLAHKASYQGKIAAESLSGLPSAADATAIPAVIFTDPEIASVGLTLDQAKAQGFDAIVGRFPFAANGRALSLDQSEGDAWVVADRDTGQILGVHLVGPEASTLIAEGTLAVELGATLEDLALTIHAHPTLSETIMEAAEVTLGRPIHMATTRRQSGGSGTSGR